MIHNALFSRVDGNLETVGHSIPPTPFDLNIQDCARADVEDRHVLSSRAQRDYKKILAPLKAGQHRFRDAQFR